MLEYINDFDSSKLPESKSEDIVKSLDEIDEILKIANTEEIINKQRARDNITMVVE